MSYFFCFDLGLSKTGVAFADHTHLPQTLPVIESRNPLNSIKQILSQYQIETIILGIPSSGPIVDLAKTYQKELESLYPNKVVLFNEDLSTKMATSKLLETPFSSTSRRQKEHSAAAAVILEDFLESSDLPSLLK